jgi:hypothetical protein
VISDNERLCEIFAGIDRDEENYLIIRYNVEWSEHHYGDLT